LVRFTLVNWVNKQMPGFLVGLSPPPGIYRIVTKGKWQVLGEGLWTATPVALAFGIDSALRLLPSIALSSGRVSLFNLVVACCARIFARDWRASSSDNHTSFDPTNRVCPIDVPLPLQVPGVAIDAEPLTSNIVI